MSIIKPKKKSLVTKMIGEAYDFYKYLDELDSDDFAIMSNGDLVEIVKDLFATIKWKHELYHD